MIKNLSREQLEAILDALPIEFPSLSREGIKGRGREFRTFYGFIKGDAIIEERTLRIFAAGGSKCTIHPE